jgi:hypothetical protein
MASSEICESCQAFEPTVLSLSQILTKGMGLKRAHSKDLRIDGALGRKQRERL